MKRSGFVAQLTVACFMLGVLIVMQLRSTGRAASVALTTSDRARVLAALVQSNAGLRSEIAELETQLAQLDTTNREENSAALQAELNRLLVLTGGAEVAGPGVRVDVSGQINPLDMQDLINELRNAGAEAIALDGRRIIVQSVVARAGSDLVLDGVHLISPHVLEAIGEPETLEKALLRPGGLVGLLEYAYPGLKVTVAKADSLSLPAQKGQHNFTFAQQAP